ncbi:hypothetical protein MKX08_002828 [Trichoderma sp. CBMAI-0020]|nr:hypothetical protein MKX08_002828 [Trichoderma sp. CBMAI-0020]
MPSHDIDVDNESRLQDSLLTAHDSVADASPNPSSMIPDNSSENKASPSSSALRVSKDYWSWELFGVLGSAAILVGIAVILDRYDGKRQPSWQHVSLNSLISWLSTAAKFCLLVPITRGLGQLKWVWLAEKERRLSDLEEFDSASRGIAGSAKLLWRLKGLHFAAIGSLTLILAAGLDPFIQNLIHYYPNAVSDPSQSAYLANTSTYTGVGQLMSGPQFDVDLGLKANVYNAILKPESSQLWAQPQYVCNTGNCTWKPVASISICPFCSDISSDLSKSCKAKTLPSTGEILQNCTLSLANGFATWFLDGELNGYPLVMDNSMENRYIRPLVYENYTFFLIQGIKALYNDTSSNFRMDLTNETQFIATECSLAPCVRSVQASVKRSIYNESAPVYWFEPRNYTADNKVIMYPPWGADLGVQEGQSFGIEPDAFRAFNNYMSSLFSGNVRLHSDTMHFNALNPDLLKAIFFGHFTDCDNPSDVVRCAVNNVVKAMSKSMWDMAYMENGTKAANMAIGETFEPCGKRAELKCKYGGIILSR